MLNLFGWGRTPTGSTTPTAVPEIDASTGLLAMAAIGAAMLFAWERRRRMEAQN